MPTEPAEPVPEAEIRSARELVRQQQPDLSTEELDRRATALARSNHLARLLTRAFEQKDVTNALQLLKQFPGNANDLRIFARPPIFLALEQHQPALLEALLERGADLNQPDPNGRLPLHVAIESRLGDMALTLLRAGASAHARDPRGGTPLETLVMSWLPRPWQPGSGPDRRHELLVVLLEKGADPFAACGTNQPTISPLEQMLLSELSEAANLALTNSPTKIRFTPGGETALHLAALWSRTNALDFLLAAGWDVNQTNRHALTPLQTLAGTYSARVLQG